MVRLWNLDHFWNGNRVRLRNLHVHRHWVRLWNVNRFVHRDRLVFDHTEDEGEEG